jgi:hypothetical protein
MVFYFVKYKKLDRWLDKRLGKGMYVYANLIILFLPRIIWSPDINFF